MSEQPTASDTEAGPFATPEAPSTWIATLSLADFRNYAGLRLTLGPRPVVLHGANGSGKTNLLEAVSLLAPGQGMRRANYADLARAGGAGGWAIAADVVTPRATIHIGTGIDPSAPSAGAGGRTVRIDHRTQKGSGALADHLEMVWLVPAMDGLFTGPASERRRFLDRLVLCLRPDSRGAAAAFERAMRQRNRLLEDDRAPAALLDGLEQQMATAGAAIAIARAATVEALAGTISRRRQASPRSAFPWARMTLEGPLEELAGAGCPFAEIQARYRERLAAMRPADRAAGRTRAGPHRSDLHVVHGPKDQAARLCSTGEQKALLVNLVLGHAELVRASPQASAPVLLLDEIAAHLDEARRAALFEELLRLGTQAWMTGTDRAPFDRLAGAADFLIVDDARVTPAR